MHPNVAEKRFCGESSKRINIHACRCSHRRRSTNATAVRRSGGSFEWQHNTVRPVNRPIEIMLNAGQYLFGVQQLYTKRHF